MSSASIPKHCDQAELVCAYAMHALPPSEVSAVESHIASCQYCREELDALLPLIDDFAIFWPIDVQRPSAALQGRLARRIAAETGTDPVMPSRRWSMPAWDEVAPGISCKLLATDTQRQCVSMLVRLAPGAEYPPHEHAGREELHLLHGELWIDGRKLLPGDYNRSERGTGDARVWSETGCTCVLITSYNDVLR